MYKKRSLLVTFEGIEGSGKSYQIRKLYKNLKKKRIQSIVTREPGGSASAEKIRELILKDYFHPKFKEKFSKYTDTLLYLAGFILFSMCSFLAAK
jgi:thymidylate kinase